MIDVKYELIVENGASGSKPIEASLIVNDIVIDGHVVIGSSSGTGTWGAIDGDIDDQLDLKERLDAKYEKPSSGIPKTDMESSVQTSLGKADTAYQKPGTGIPSTDMATAVQTSLGKADTAYQKPSGGIPSSDMTSAVQTSLGKADSALQESDVVNGTSSTSTTKPVSANTAYEMEQQILNLIALGRFLSLWDCITGLPRSNPIGGVPYAYKTGDYYFICNCILSLIDETDEYDDSADYDVDDLTVHEDALYKCNTAITGGEAWNPSHWTAITDNYIPDGSSYTGTASSTTSSEEIRDKDVYWYDGANWLLLKNTGKTLAFENIAGDPLDNLALAAEFSDVVRYDSGTPGVAPPLNADQLNGHADSYFATEAEADAVRGGTSEYDPLSTYDTGDFCIKTNVLYRCLEDNVTGVFDVTKWEVVDLTTLKDEVETNKTDIATNASAITSLISSLTWKNIVTDQVGTAQIPLPTGWKELLAVIHVYDGSTYKVASASFYILSEMVLGTATLFRAGHMESSSSSSDICLRVSDDKTWCALSDAVWNLSEKKATSKISVWYR